MRGAITALFRTLLRLFFRRIEVAGLENVPRDRPVIFAANHPNGLVDPLFILCFAPRRVAFLAKAPLFRYPVIGYLVRVVESIPVYRKQDNANGSNVETFARARELLRDGGSIAIFPEGTTHSDPRLHEFKTGAARIALGSELPSIAIVPAGIYYTAKQTFRSEALVWFGAPIDVGGGGAPSPVPDAVMNLTHRIEAQLASVTLQADSRAALELIARAERMFSAGEEQPLASQLEVRRRFVNGYHYLREHDPQRLEDLASKVRQFEAELGGAKMDPEDLSARIDAAAVARAVLLLPFAIGGAIVHFVPYRIVDFLARRLSGGEDEMTATIKFIAALAIYPLTWIAFAIWVGGLRGLFALLVLPLLGYVALRVVETADEVIGSLRSLRY
ncbi:MAG TPA: lysophospholipid acyltransferase family protein, partial [Thermoanaerobaculia bacterium]|nr:lysophospholipid acyltransferase family protein [Thermoanaerobaculia bacterium]